MRVRLHCFVAASSNHADTTWAREIQPVATNKWHKQNREENEYSLTAPYKWTISLLKSQLCHCQSQRFQARWSRSGWSGWCLNAPFEIYKLLKHSSKRNAALQAIKEQISREAPGLRTLQPTGRKRARQTSLVYRWDKSTCTSGLFY